MADSGNLASFLELMILDFRKESTTATVVDQH